MITAICHVCVNILAKVGQYNLGDGASLPVSWPSLAYM